MYIPWEGMQANLGRTTVINNILSKIAEQA